jgi:hypothetical protein
MSPTKPTIKDEIELPAPIEIDAEFAAAIAEDLYSGNPRGLSCGKCGNTRACADPECPLARELAKEPPPVLKRQYGLYYKASKEFVLLDVPLADLLAKFGADGKTDEVTLFVEYSRSQPGKESEK